MVQNVVNGRVLDIATVGAGYMQALVLLIETAFKQVVVDAINNFVFKLANVVDSEYSHHVCVGDNSLL